MPNFELSTYQQDILDFFINHSGDNMYINALAGVGKSSTACMLTEHTTTSDVYIAFNKSIAEEFKTKIKNPKTKVYTIHGLSYLIMNNNTEKDIEIDNLKFYKIIDEKVSKYYKYKKFEYKVFVKDNFVQLYNLCRLTYINLNDDREILDLVGDYNLFVDNGACKNETIPDNSQICEWIRFMNEQDFNVFEKENKIDFTDMLYITLNKLSSKEWEVPYFLRFTNVYLDEAQDFSNIQLYLFKYIKRSNGRYIFILDKNQAIYGFAASNCNAYQVIKKLFAPVTEFDLPINYRCPESHLSLVRNRFDIPIQARPNAPQGEIFTINKQDISKYVKGGDFVISRKNKWLTEVILDLVKHGIPIYMEDKEMVKDICKTIEKSKAFNIDVLYSNLQEKKKSFDNSIKKVKKDNNIPDGEKESIVSNTNGFIDNINFINDILKSYKGDKDISSFLSYIKKLLNTTFSDKCVRLSSIHKAKGLEGENVFILNEAKVCFDSRNSFDLNQQEKNLAYISLTRAKNNLYLVREPSEK